LRQPLADAARLAKLQAEAMPDPAPGLAPKLLMQRADAELAKAMHLMSKALRTVNSEPTASAMKTMKQAAKIRGAMNHVRMIRVTGKRPTCEGRHRRAPGMKPVKRRGSRRTTAPTRGSPDDDLPPEPDLAASSRPTERAAV
jgi:hypothetical protein